MIGTFAGELCQTRFMGKAAPGWRLNYPDDDGVPVPRGGKRASRHLPEKRRPVGLMEDYVIVRKRIRKLLQRIYYTGDKAWMDKDGILVCRRTTTSSKFRLRISRRR